MDTINILNSEFSAQDFSEVKISEDMLNIYKDTARNYADIENAIAVLSDVKTNVSYIYYGKFADILAIERDENEEVVSSIWEKGIFNAIHKEDLSDKHLRELCFFNFIKRQQRQVRSKYYLMSRIRMMTKDGGYVNVIHRMFYITIPSNGSLWLSLCLYSPLMFDSDFRCIVVDSINGHTFELEKENNSKILSNREKQILHLIDNGMMSKEISKILSISINTVSRHRQEILGKLQAKNSIEACRIARDLNLI